MINILFDQYQRYNNIKLIVDQMRTENQVFNILEVGANEHRNLENFLPDDNIKYLDISLPDHLLTDPNYILGDATDMTFQDNSFDVVVALDVFEHIPENRRKNFIDELHRVSKEFFVITAPFASSSVSLAENAVNSFYKGLFKKDFIWLQEHIDNGLPNLKKTEEYLKSKQVEYKILNHGNLNIWRTMMKIHFSAAKNPELASYRQEMDIFYNTMLFPFDYTENSYRKIIIGSKQKDISLISNLGQYQNMEQNKIDELYEREKDFYHMSFLLADQHHAQDASKQNLSTLKLYLDSGNGYNESETITGNISESTFSTQYNFNLSEFSALKSLRLDPTESLGAFKIDNIRFINKKGNEIQYQLSGNFNFVKSKIYFFKQEDPFFIFDFDEDEAVELLSFQFDMDCVSLNPNSLFTEIENETLNQEIKTQQIISKYETELDDLKSELKKIEKDNMNLNEAIDKKKSSFNESIDKYKETLQNLNQELEMISKEKNELNIELLNIYNSKAWKSVVIARRFVGK
ncbi:methyltransferase domain-containing protein [Paenibacillus sp. PsM32]|uniref:methyltransferase domain-containing protein n=1 Tax=Paenibacillus sp. PsM32 TaxID=3030536 RepID=UPI00263A9A62|nr:methyltransferase domain-containing protein [Paenibacillus sp. PsM32]MDN4620688.1 methyltransferase domain-containing protein [Paenibacillus sp. PsM32]